MKKFKNFKFVYSFADGEIPEAWYIGVNNITNAKREWETFLGYQIEEALEENNYVLLAIFERVEDGWDEVWESDIKTGFHLESVH